MVHKQTKSLLKREGLAPKKKLGQNFLVHEHTARRIVDLAGVSKDDTIIEVGVGLGALTRPLADAAGQVIGLEADSGIIRLHTEQQDLPDNVELIHIDVLKADLRELATKIDDRLRFVANLPYSISTPFIFSLIDHADLIHSAIIMLQKEVAQRLMAEPGTKEYGAPTVLLASCAEVKPLLMVKPAEFHPRPKVDSMVVKITFHPVPERVQHIGPYDVALLRKIVRGAFSQRRKTLLNGLSSLGLPQDKGQLSTLIKAAGLIPSVRAERLELEHFVNLTQVIASALGTSNN